jgi:hypothetical protein
VVTVMGLTIASARIGIERCLVGTLSAPCCRMSLRRFGEVVVAQLGEDVRVLVKLQSYIFLRNYRGHDAGSFVAEQGQVIKG